MDIWDDPRAKHLLRTIYDLVPESYLVGGAVRDHLMGKPVQTDLDLAVQGDGFLLARRVAAGLEHEAAFVPLDEENGTGRLVLRGETPLTVDISSFKGSDVREDLLLRDFTINAVALPLSGLMSEDWSCVVDPSGGIADLQAKKVRMCSDRSFDDDPLRIMRAFRFKVALEFGIDPGTLSAIERTLPRLRDVSMERVRDEFAMVLSAAFSVAALTEMDQEGVIDLLFPDLIPMKGCSQNDYHHLDVWGHTLEAVGCLETLLRSLPERFGETAEAIAAYLRDEPVRDRPRTVLLKLAVIFHDAGKPHSRTIDPSGRIHFYGHENISRDMFDRCGERLKLAGREIKLVREWISGHMRPMFFTTGPVSRRSVYRLHRDFGLETIGLFLLFLADLGASRGPAGLRSRYEDALEQVRNALNMIMESEESPTPPLLNGRDVMNLLGLPPGPVIGRILARLAELQAIGEITTREEAITVIDGLTLEDL